MTKSPKPGSEVFDKLVTELSVQERQDLLSRMRFSQVVDEAPLHEPEASPEDRFDRVSGDLSLLERLMLFLRAVFTGKDRVALVEEFALKRIAKALTTGAREYFNPRAMQLLDGFASKLSALRDAAEIFRTPLREALGSHKKDFVAFLTGFELPVVQEHLLRESDPENHERLVTELSEFDMKRTLDSSLQDTLDEIGESDRQLMYRNIQLLHWLQSLASFGFERLIDRFDGIVGERMCQATTIVPALKELAAILQRLSVPPTTRLVSALFLFEARERLSEKEFDLETSLQVGVESARDALAEIRRFNAEIPLNDIIRVVVNDADWVPALKGGGEDWFVLFKQFWTTRVEERVGEFVSVRRRRQLLEAAVKMLNLGELPYLSNYRTSTDGVVIYARHEHSLAFLRGFLEQVFSKDLNRTIKLFLLDGKFYKDDNRKDFTDAYNDIERIPERIRNLDSELSAEGHKGKTLRQIIEENSLPGARERAVANLFISVDRDAETIVIGGQKNLHLLQSVVDGILHGHGDDTYDTISNLTKIGGRENRRLIASLRVGSGRLAAANEILDGLIAVETGRET